MAIEHEPGCDGQHTARQRCNQHALFAEQGEVPAEVEAEEGDAPTAISAVSQRLKPESETVEETIAIREEVIIEEPAPEPPRPEREWREPDRAGGYALLIAVALAFAIVTAVLIVLLRSPGDAGERT